MSTQTINLMSNSSGISPARGQVGGPFRPEPVASHRPGQVGGRLVFRLLVNCLSPAVSCFSPAVGRRQLPSEDRQVQQLRQPITRLLQQLHLVQHLLAATCSDLQQTEQSAADIVCRPKENKMNQASHDLILSKEASADILSK